MTGNAVKGAKGGSSSNRAPVESPDSLYSIAYARILDLLSEGPVVGLADGLKSVFLDETPVANADGSLNFKNVQIDTRVGTQDQDYIKGFPSVESELGVGVELTQGTPYTRAINNLSLDAVRVRLSTPTLTKTNTSTGDVTGTSVSYAIDLATDGGSFQTVLTSAFTGKTTSKYERSHRIDLPSATTGWTLRVRRLTADSASGYLVNKTYVESFAEIVDAKLRYPNSAVAAVVVDAEQFQSIPSRSYDLIGRIIQVPSNYNPATRTYTGIWDGTFQPAWSDNPAWIYYDMVTHPRYGLGHLVAASMVDKWNLYKIGRYCDELVPDGAGGTEPRFRCNLYIQSRADAWKLLQDLASAFRGISYWAGGTIKAVADMPEDPAYIYTPANVVNGKFLYQGSAKKARHTVALVSWNDPSDFGRAKIEYVSDEEGIARYGINQTEVIAFGCTSKAQAQRAGRWLLLTERYETQTVSFSVGLDGTVAAPGQIILIADTARAGQRIGGRVKLATTAAITVDVLPPVVAGNKITCIMPDATAQQRTVQSVAGSVITVTEAFDQIPLVGSIWTVESATLAAQRFRVLSVTESDGITFSITAVQHAEDKFDAVEYGTAIEEPPVTQLPLPSQQPPTAVNMTSFERAGLVLASSVVSASWDPVPGAVEYSIEWQVADRGWTTPQRVNGLAAEYDNAFQGIYRARVTAVNANGIRSTPKASGPYVLADQTATPAAVLDALTAAAAAQAAADLAQATADGAITTYLQASPPTGLGTGDVGDLWMDSDDSNKVYRWSGSAWVVAQDGGIATAIAAAAGAQATANGKVKTFFQTSAPTATAVGDLWIDTDDGNKLYRWNGASWVVAQDTGIAAAYTAATNAQATADGKIASFWQASPPTIGSSAGQAKVGDIWFDTDDGNKVYRVVGSSWTLAADDDMAAALAAASDAQATADGKVQTFFAATAPTAEAVGDLWFNTTTKQLLRWNGSAWSQTIADIGAIEASLTGSGNLLPGSGFDSVAISGWTVAVDTAGLGNLLGVDIAAPDWLPYGMHTLGWVRAGLPTGEYTAWSPAVPATPGKRYCASIYSAMHRTTGRFEIQFHNAAGAFLGNATNDNVAGGGGNRLTAYLRPYVFAVAPANTATARVVFRSYAATGDQPYVWLCRPMLEEVSDIATRPSPWVPSASGLDAKVVNAIAAAGAAQDTADGKIDSYFQTTAPAGATLGDLWFDTDDGNKQYRHNGSSWVAVQDTAIGSAIAAAAGAQATADGKVKTFFTTTTPTASGVGDLWYRDDTKILYRWNGSSWVVIQSVNSASSDYVMDGQFEQQFQHWDTQAQWYWETTGGYNGTGHATVGGSSGTPASRITNKKGFAVAPGEAYLVSALMKNVGAANGSHMIEVLLSDANGAGVANPGVTLTATANWSRQKGVIVIPANAVMAWVSLVRYSHTTGYMYWDDIRVQRLAQDTTENLLGVGKNLLPNASFGGGNGSLVPWVSSSSAGHALTLNNKRSGINAAPGYLLATIDGQMSTLSTYAASSEFWDIVCDRPVSVVPGQRYEAYIHVASHRCDHQLYVLYQDGNGTGLLYTPMGALLTATSSGAATLDQYTRVGGFSVAPAGAARAIFFIRRANHVSPNGDSYSWYTRPYFGAAGANQLQFSDWVEGPLHSADSISTGSEAGVVNIADLYDGGNTRRIGLRVPGSGQRLGGQRNNVRSSTSAYGMTRTTTALSATSAGAVTVNAHTCRYGGYSVSYNAVSNAVTGLTQNTTYVIYCYDADLSGGTKTYFAGTNPDAVMNLSDDIYVVGQIKIPTSGSSSGGSGGGGTNPDDWCVAADSFLPDGTLAGELPEGRFLPCYNNRPEEPNIVHLPVQRNVQADSECLRLVTVSGASIVASVTTPMTLRNGACVLLPEMLHREALVYRRDGTFTWEQVTALQPVGVRRVAKISVSDQCYFAGETLDAFIATHNIQQMKP